LRAIHHRSVFAEPLQRCCSTMSAWVRLFPLPARKSWPIYPRERRPEVQTKNHQQPGKLLQVRHHIWRCWAIGASGAAGTGRAAFARTAGTQSASTRFVRDQYRRQPTCWNTWLPTPRAFAVAESVMGQEPEAVLTVEPLPALATPWIDSPPGSLNQVRHRQCARGRLILSHQTFPLSVSRKPW